MRVTFPLAAALLLAACDALPRDPGGTADRIAATRRLRVGIEAHGPLPPEGARLLDALTGATGAQAELSRGGLEPLLAAVADGHIDLAIAWFDAETPWADRVALGPPLAERRAGDHRLQLRAAARNGENRWIMRVERSSRRAAADTAR